MQDLRFDISIKKVFDRYIVLVVRKNGKLTERIEAGALWSRTWTDSPNLFQGPKQRFLFDNWLMLHPCSTSDRLSGCRWRSWWSWRSWGGGGGGHCS